MFELKFRVRAELRLEIKFSGGAELKLKFKI